MQSYLNGESTVTDLPKTSKMVSDPKRKYHLKTIKLSVDEK